MQCSNLGFILLLFILPFPNGWSVDHGLSHPIKGHFLFFRLRIAQEKVKGTNAKIMCKTIEKVSFRQVGIKPWAENKEVRRRVVGHAWVGKVFTLCQSNFGDEHSLSKIIFLRITLPLKVNRAPFKYLQRTSTFQITHILRKHHAYALKPQHLTLHPHYPTMQAPQYETPLHQVPWHHLSCHFQTLHIKCLCTKGLLCHIFWNYVIPDSRLGGDT